MIAPCLPFSVGWSRLCVLGGYRLPSGRKKRLSGAPNANKTHTKIGRRSVGVAI